MLVPKVSAMELNYHGIEEHRHTYYLCLVCLRRLARLACGIRRLELNLIKIQWAPSSHEDRVDPRETIFGMPFSRVLRRCFLCSKPYTAAPNPDHLFVSFSHTHTPAAFDMLVRAETSSNETSTRIIVQPLRTNWRLSTCWCTIRYRAINHTHTKTFQPYALIGVF